MKKLFTLITGYIVANIGANRLKKVLLLISFIFVMTSARSEFTSMLTSKGEVKGYKVPEEFYHKFKRNRMLRDNDANSASLLSKKLPGKNLLPVSAQSLYGYLYFSGDDSNIKGIYKIDGKNLDMLYIDDLYGDYWITPINGWYRDGNICGLTMVTDEIGEFIYGYIYYELDFETGALVKLKDLPLNPVMFMTCTLNPENDYIYGYIIDLENYKIYWGTTTLSNPHENNIIQEVTGSECYSICYNPNDGSLYGMNAKQQFVKIDPDGTQTVINGDIEESENFLDYYAGITWNREKGCFYANINLRDRSSRIYTVSPQGKFDLVTSYNESEEFSFLFSANDIIMNNQPEAPVIESINFVGSNLSGSMTFTMPRLFGDGSSLPATMKYNATLDGVIVKNAEAAPGEVIKVEYTVAEAGMHTFGIFVTVNEINSERVTRNIYIGNDTPLAPLNIVLSPEKLTWSPVTAGVHGGYVDPSAMTYEVYLNNEYFGFTSDTMMEMDFSGMELAGFQAAVYAVCNEMKGSPGYSNLIVAGDPFTPPIDFLPNLDEIALMTVIDNNVDGSTWMYNPTYNAVQIGHSPNFSNPMDDYVFLPPIQIENVDKYYTFSLRSAIHMTNCVNEYFEVVYATSPDPRTVLGTIINKTSPTMAYSWDYEQWDYNEGLWKVPEPGVYYIGIHCISDADQWGMFVNRFALDISDIKDSSPDVVTNLTAVAAENAVLEATLSFTIPTKDIGGTPYGDNKILRVLLTDNDTPIDMDITGKPGEDISVVVPAFQSNNNYCVRLQDGDMIGPFAYVDVYVGYSVPACATNLRGKVGPDMMTATIEWDPVTEPYIEGGYVNPETIYYTVWMQYYDGFAHYWFCAYPDFYIHDTHASIDFRDIYNNYADISYADMPQNWYSLSVDARNEAGDNGYVAPPVTLYMGCPYELPYVDKFDSASISNYSASTKPWTPYSEIAGNKQTASWSSIPVGSAYALVGNPGNVVPSSGTMGMPRFSTKGMKNVELSLDIRMGANTPQISIYAEIYGSYDLTYIGTVDVDKSANQEFRKVTFALPEKLMDQYWVQVYYIVEYSEKTQSFAMNNVYVNGEEAGVSSVTDAKASIIGADGIVILRGLAGKNVVINTIDGKRVASFKAVDNDCSYALDKGLYIVNAGKYRTKVFVR